MVKFKVLIIIFLLTTVLANPAFNKDESVKRFHIASDECIKEVGATSVDLQDLISRKPPGGMPGKCLRSCLMKKFKVMDSNGKFVKSVALDEARRITNGDVEKMKLALVMVNICSDILVSTNHCDAASEYDQCFKEQVKIMGLPEY